MIYLSDDYLTKYIDTFGYIIERASFEGYSFPHIEKVIAYSEFADELEKSDITTIAFSNAEIIYRDLFPKSNNLNHFVSNPYNEYGWLAFVYLHLFLEFKVTFEMLFIVLPLEKALSLYKIYHEMDIKKIYQVFKESIKYSYLNMIMNSRNISSKELSELSGVPYATINALRYKKRDIGKTESIKLFKIAKSLNIKLTTLIENLDLEMK